MIKRLKRLLKRKIKDLLQVVQTVAHLILPQALKVIVMIIKAVKVKKKMLMPDLLKVLKFQRNMNS